MSKGKSKQAALSAQPVMPINQINHYLLTNILHIAWLPALWLFVNQYFAYYLVIIIPENYGVKPAGH